MDITPQDATTQPISDDQELAKALAGVLPDEPGVPVNGTENISEMQFEETPAPIPPAPVPAPAPIVEAPIVPSETPVIPAFDVPVPTQDSSLEGVKKDAIQELRPLIDHIDLPPEEKFDTYLLLIRSTDDSSLIAPAHVAAQSITDEKRKAEALLDIIKEIDYLSKKDSATL